MRVRRPGSRALVVLVWCLAVTVPSIAEDIGVVVRVAKSFESITNNWPALRAFEAQFHADAMFALDVNASRLTIEFVMEGTEEGPQAPEVGHGKGIMYLGNEYQGSTTLVYLRILDALDRTGQPSSSDLLTKLKEMLTDTSSKWYQGEMTGRADSSTVPLDHMLQSNRETTVATRTLPLGLIVPVGIAPLGLLLVMYFAMAKASRRKPQKGDKYFKHGLLKKTKDGHILGEDSEERNEAFWAGKGKWSKGNVPDYGHSRDKFEADNAKNPGE